MKMSHFLACVLALLALVLLAPLTINLGTLIPITLQSLVVLTVAISLGAGWGTFVVILYLILGGLGLPIFADGSSGWEKFIGPTAGFLLGFAVSSLVVGWIGEHSNRRNLWTLIKLFVLGHLIILFFGFLYLINFKPWMEILGGIYPPLLPGLLVKSLIGALIIFLIGKFTWAKKPSLT